jgi:N-acetylneuraminic acid mutarotase
MKVVMKVRVLGLVAVSVLLSGCVRIGLGVGDKDAGPDGSQPGPDGGEVTTFIGDSLWPSANQGNGTALHEEAVELETVRSFELKQPTLPEKVAWGTAAPTTDALYVFGGAMTEDDAKTNARSDSISRYVPANDKLSAAGKLTKGLSMSAAVAVREDGQEAIYLVKGYDIDYTFETKMQRYDVGQESVSTLGLTFISANRHAAALVDDQIYIFGGYGTGPIRYEVQSVRVEEEEETGGENTVSAVTPNLMALGGRTFLAACVANGDIYLFGGDRKESHPPGTAIEPVDEILRVRPGASIEKVATLPMPLKGMAAGLLPDGKIILAGGDTMTGSSSQRTDAVIEFDPATKEVKLRSETLPYPVSGAAYAVFGGRLYLFGGLTDNGLSDRILEYQPFAGSGSVEGEPVDSGVAGTIWRELRWEATIPASTTLELDVRASDEPPAGDEPAWQPVTAASPVSSGLPTGRYLQWRARLATSNGSVTPRLTSVTVSY